MKKAQRKKERNFCLFLAVNVSFIGLAYQGKDIVFRFIILYRVA
jgi:hypothetical protein